MPDNKPDARPQTAPQAFAAPPKAPITTFYTVLHSAVGSYSQGAVISSADLQDIDVKRLLDLGAIAVTSAPIADVSPADDEH